MSTTAMRDLFCKNLPLSDDLSRPYNSHGRFLDFDWNINASFSGLGASPKNDSICL